MASLRSPRLLLHFKIQLLPPPVPGLSLGKAPAKVFPTRRTLGLGDGREMEEGRGLHGVGAGVPQAETPLSFGFGFGSGDCSCYRGKGSGPWDLSSDPEGETGGVKGWGKRG